MANAIYRHTVLEKQPNSWELALGLEGLSGLARLDRVQEGLPVTAFHRFAETSGAARQQLADAIGVSLRTVQRRSETAGRLAAGPSARLVRLADLYSRAAEALGSDDLARQWMQTPREVFRERTPFELAANELGAREVEDLLLRIEYGVFY